MRKLSRAKILKGMLVMIMACILCAPVQAKFNDKILRVINVVCGLIIIFYGAKLLLQFFQTLL